MAMRESKLAWLSSGCLHISAIRKPPHQVQKPGPPIISNMNTNTITAQVIVKVHGE